MPNTIQDLLDNIENARYGADVRSSIHDAIEMCYDNTATGKTTAQEAAEAATANVTAAISSLTTLTERTETAAGNAEQATSDAQTAAAAAELAAGSIADAITTAQNAADTAATAIGNLTALQTTINSALNTVNSLSSNTSSTLNTINSLIDTTTRASNSATTAAGEAIAARDTALQSAGTAANAVTDCIQAKSEAVIATSRANNAAGRAETAASAIEDLSVSSEDVGPDGTMQVSVTTIDDHTNFHFKLKQGQPGTSYIIKGHVYETVSDLEEDITNPAVGDQYNVGTSTPYHVYRWTGEEWEDQGQIGFSIDNLSNAEIDTLWNGTTLSGSSKYMNQTGFLYFIVNKIKAALTNKVDKSGTKVLSTYDFNDDYKNKIDNNESSITLLSSGKVDKVSGMGLSSNDFTTEYMTRIANSENSITALQNTVAGNKPTSFTVTLSSSGWSDNAQAVSDSRFVSSGYVYWVAASGSSRNNYVNADIYADDVTTTGSITFHCATVPSVDLTVNVIRMVSA